jgi:hypothetical protein
VLAMPYADPRAYMERLDEVCGLDWSLRYTSWGDHRIVAELTIAGVTRSSTGEMDETDTKSGIGGTAAEAQAFKRACAMFNLGRYLYELPSVWVDYDTQKKRITEEAVAKLDGRYRAWYAKKITVGSAAETLAESLIGVGGEEPLTTTTTLPTATAQIFNAGFDTPVHRRMYEVLGRCFGDEADAALPWLLRTWTGKHSPPRRDALADLSLDEVDLLTDNINANCNALGQSWKRQKPKELAGAN